MYIQLHQVLKTKGRAQKVFRYKAFIVLVVGKCIHKQVKHQYKAVLG